MWPKADYSHSSVARTARHPCSVSRTAIGVSASPLFVVLPTWSKRNWPLGHRTGTDWELQRSGKEPREPTENATRHLRQTNTTTLHAYAKTRTLDQISIKTFNPRETKGNRPMHGESFCKMSSILTYSVTHQLVGDALYSSIHFKTVTLDKFPAVLAQTRCFLVPFSGKGSCAVQWSCVFVGKAASVLSANMLQTDVAFCTN